jgi:hypothetical protein
MKPTNKAQLETLENEVNAELETIAESGTPGSEPITDGVVDIDLYLSSSPKILWILKEPVDEVINGVPSGGGWSLTKHILAEGKFGNKPPFAPMAYVAYAVFHDFPKWSGIKYVTEDLEVRESVKRIAYINVSKMPAHTTSGGTDLTDCYRRNRHILLKQIEDIIIGGNTLRLFFADLGINAAQFTTQGSADFCIKENRLYIDAYHPSQWSTVDNDVYVDDIVTIIKNHSPILPPTQTPIGNQES